MRAAAGGLPSGTRLLLYQADYAVVIPAATVDHAELAAVAVVERVEVVAYEFHLEERLIDGHRVRGVELLPDDQGAVALHLDRHQAGRSRLHRGLVLVVPVFDLVGHRRQGQDSLRADPPVQLAAASPVGSGRAFRGSGCFWRAWRARWADRAGRRRCPALRGGHRRDHLDGRDRSDVRAAGLTPLGCPAQPSLELGERQVEGRVSVVRGRLRPYRRAPGPYRELYPLTSIRLPRGALLRHLDIDAGRPLIELLELGQLGRSMPAETLRNAGVPALEGDVHLSIPLRLELPDGRHSPGRPGLRPHIRLLRGSRPL